MTRQLSMDLNDLGVSELEQKVYDLAKLCEHLRGENARLRTREAALLKERQELIERNVTAKGKVESIITRLNDMEYEE